MGRKLIHVAGKPTQKPEGSGVITTYNELKDKATTFAVGMYPLISVAGDPGIGKTRTFENALNHIIGQDDYLFLGANTSPFGAYVKACHRRKHRLRAFCQNKLAIGCDRSSVLLNTREDPYEHVENPSPTRR